MIVVIGAEKALHDSGEDRPPYTGGRRREVDRGIGLARSTRWDGFRMLIPLVEQQRGRLISGKPVGLRSPASRETAAAELAPSTLPANRLILSYSTSCLPL